MWVDIAFDLIMVQRYGGFLTIFLYLWFSEMQLFWAQKSCQRLSMVAVLAINDITDKWDYKAELYRQIFKQKTSALKPSYNFNPVFRDSEIQVKSYYQTTFNRLNIKHITFVFISIFTLAQCISCPTKLCTFPSCVEQCHLPRLVVRQSGLLATCIYFTY